MGCGLAVTVGYAVAMLVIPGKNSDFAIGTKVEASITSGSYLFGKFEKDRKWQKGGRGYLYKSLNSPLRDAKHDDNAFPRR